MEGSRFLYFTPMLLSRRQWEPDEWQRWVDQLLYARYGHAGYQRVPDGHGGDWGIEGFSRDGCVYQCYVAEEPVSTKDLHERQRDKMHVDVKKFTTNVAELSKLFTGLRIGCWCLVVPRFDSAKLLAYAAEKSDEVKALKLPYVSDDFAIQVCSDESWPVEVARLTSAGAGKIAFDTSVGESDQVEVWTNANVGDVQKLRKKAAQLTRPTATERFVQGSIRAYIRGQNAHETLQADFPEVFQAVSRVKASVENQLETDCAIDVGGSVVTFRAVRVKLISRLKEELSNLSAQLVDELADEALADWLLRCPLYFDEDQNDVG